MITQSILCDYTDACKLFKGRITIIGAGGKDGARVIFKNCSPFINCKSEINNTETDDARDIDMVMPLYNQSEYSDSYSKACESLWQYYRDDPNDNLTDSESFKSKMKITGRNPSNGNTKDVEIIASLKYLSNFWRTTEMPLINCELNLIVRWSSTCVINNSAGV